MVSDGNCDCWTNDRGEWVLGVSCARADLEVWRTMMDGLTHDRIMEMVHNPPARETGFRWVDGSLTLGQWE